ncbi:MAG: glycosyltransferase family 29 protein, partial [Deltaproteobacteria bacterium]|nr:glycosyltransferase family 29 protein [Deltaproteobacteria bacterium]
MQALEKIHPEVAERLNARRGNLPQALLEGMDAYYRRVRPANTFRNVQAQAVAGLGGKMLASLSAEEVTAIFQEAVRLAGDRKNIVLRNFITCLHTFILDDTLLLSALTEFERLHGIWGTGFRRTWIIHISVLLRSGDTGKALVMLKKYHAQYGLKDLERSPPAARFAHRNGFSNKKIAAAAFIANEVEKNIAANLFPGLVRQKSIAVVGSGPFELGRGKGEEIDAHDIVIRFNLAETKGHEVDYGSRTDIWAVNAAGADYSRVKEPAVIFLCETLDRHAYAPQTIQSLAVAAKRNGCRLTSIPPATYRELVRAMNCLNPTSGLITVGYAKKINPALGLGD